MTETIDRYYYLQESTKTIFHIRTDAPQLTKPASTELTYMGRSDNHNIKMAAQIFMRQGKCLTGCKIKEYSKE